MENNKDLDKDLDLDIDENFLELKDKRLGCFCKQPGIEIACHIDIIKEWLDNLDYLE